MNQDYLLRYILVGDFSVGKTQLIRSFLHQPQPQHQTHQHLIAFDFHYKTINSHGKTVKLQIWDSPGSQRYHTIPANYYKRANAVLFVYDITNAGSFQNIQNYWLGEAQQHAGVGVQMVLIGNKCDMKDRQNVPTEQAETFARDCGMLFMEVSANSGQNVKQCLELITDSVIEELESTQGKAERLKKIDLSSQAIGRGNRVASSCC